MQRYHYIAGDWGTSCLRLYLASAENGEYIQELKGEGIANTQTKDIPKIIDELTLAWRQQYDISIVILCGMVGSNIGWIDTGYCQCPASVKDLATNAKYIKLKELDIYIVPGLKTKNHISDIDLMRGEETQLIGAIDNHNSLKTTEQLVGMPGTHNKWVMLNNGQISSFITSFSGELYAVLTKFSILKNTNNKINEREFIAGVQHSVQNVDVDLMFLIFEARSRKNTNKISCSNSFLSGLIIGKDIATARTIYKIDTAELVCIGEPSLTACYKLAASQMQLNTIELDGAKASNAGLYSIYKELIC